MEVKLLILDGKHAGKSVPVAGPKFFIGRSEECHLRPQSDLVSRHHCVILVEEGFVSIRDFGSRNGTVVNGEQIKSECELKNGDQLKVGPLRFEVRLGMAELIGKKKPKVHSVQEAAARTVENARSVENVKSTTQEEADISQWLGSDADTTPSAVPTDTTPIATTATNAGKVAAPPQEEPKTTKDETQTEPTPKTPRRPPPAKKPTSASSGDAAAEVLRKLFGRR